MCADGSASTASAPGWPPARAARSSSAVARRGASGFPPDRLHGPSSVQRRHRLSRSRDFDAVYRQGRSVSTRYLVLYWFGREADDQPPRVGLAVPRKVGGAVKRNRLKRQLREVWNALLGELPPDHDYVLVVRPGLAEAAESRGSGWLRERVTEVLQKAELLRRTPA